MKCPSCGLELDESLKFCEGCGAPIVKSPATSPSPQPPPPPAAPAPAMPKAPEAPKKKGGKCGCIAAIAIVVLLVLLGLCLGGGYYFWNRGLKDKWESLRNKGEGSARIHAPAHKPDSLPRSSSERITA